MIPPARRTTISSAIAFLALVAAAVPAASGKPPGDKGGKPDWVEAPAVTAPIPPPEEPGRKVGHGKAKKKYKGAPPPAAVAPLAAPTPPPVAAPAPAAETPISASLPAFRSGTTGASTGRSRRTALRRPATAAPRGPRPRSARSPASRVARSALPATRRTPALVGLAAKTPSLPREVSARRLHDSPGLGPAVVVERIVEKIPTFVWLALAALALLAIGGIAAAFLLGRRARGVEAEAIGLAAAAQTDPLTGVLNRRGLHHRLEAELLRAGRYGRPLAVSYVDIAGFKAVNDRFGHKTGDQLLSAIAETLEAESRHEDLVGRVGGDEYLVALTEQDAVGAEHFWARTRHRLESARDTLPGDWEVTTGTAIFPDDAEDLDSLLQIADRRLYANRGIELR